MEVVVEWDARKADVNRRKHGVTFEEAQQVFDDPLHLSRRDERLPGGEERWITIGRAAHALLLVVANTVMDRDGTEVLRIISARRASPKERRQYEDYGF
jgi:uncharacterized protein